MADAFAENSLPIKDSEPSQSERHSKYITGSDAYSSFGTDVDGSSQSDIYEECIIDSDETKSLPSSIGTVITSNGVGGKSNIKNEGRINVKEAGDETTSWITGCVELDDDILIIGDYNNSKIKLVDLEKSELVSVLKLPIAPFDICRMNYKQVVASAEGRLIVVNIDRGLRMRVEKEVPVSGTCSAVQCYQENFLVSIIDHNPVLQEITPSGMVVRTIHKDIAEDTTLTSPFYILADEDERTLYVSDCDSHEVYCIGEENTVIQTYSNNKLLQKPFGLAADGQGGLYVVGSGSSNIHHISRFCELHQVCLEIEDGINEPQTVAFWKKSKKLVVSTNALGTCSNTDSLMIFRMDT